MKLSIPELSLVVLIGSSGSGKSTFARKHFKGTEIISSDYCRGLVSDDENDLAATKPAFEVLHFIASKRLSAGKLTVIDATNVQAESRKPLVELARSYHCLPVAIVLNLPEKICYDRNAERPDRSFGPHVVHQHTTQLKRSLGYLKREGFRHIHVLNSLEEVEAAEIIRDPLYNNKRHESGPFDLIGDVHGCFDELMELLRNLGYQIAGPSDKGHYEISHPERRRAVFLGDIVDRGPKITDVLRLVMSMVESGTAFCVPGNHDMKLMRKLGGRDVQITHGLADSLEQLELETAELRDKVKSFLDGLVSHYVFDDGKLVAAHAGMREEMQGRGSRRVRDFALYGETTGETDEFGLPIRYNWAAEYRGKAMVVYGHTPVPDPDWLNRTINIDTGCVFGGKLTALRYPESELVSVSAKNTYAESAKPFLPEGDCAPALTAQQEHDCVLDIDDVFGKRIISTRLHHNITIREENSTAALEVMSRFAANPKWLIYLPPTMSPCETSKEAGFLEYPTEAFSYYRHQGVSKVVCEEKHMGSRAVVIVCRDEDAARRRFGVECEGMGICYTRTGRRFFTDSQLESRLVEHVRAAMESTGFWDEFKTDWACLDCELMPWSAKAQDLIRQQYAPVGVAARVALTEVASLLDESENRGIDIAEIAGRFAGRLDMASRYTDAYRRYCWPVNSLEDFKLAPFHILATEGCVHSNRDHIWHMDTLSEVCRADAQILHATPYMVVDVTDPVSEEEGVRWWEELTGKGGEGMVVKPFDFITKGQRDIVQPAIKCRGREYLRIIYGPEYTAPKNLDRLRSRRLAGKRSLASREFALGIESLERFVRHEPLRRVHECVFGVLALESEPVDPRL